MKRVVFKARGLWQPRRLFNFLMVGVIVVSILPTLLIASFFGQTSFAVTSSQGPRTASATGNCVNDTGTGTVAWTNPGNAFSANTTYATSSVDGTVSNYIKCTNFGFTIPTGATISGITLGMTRLSNSTGNGGSQDSAIRLVKGGVIGSTDRKTTTIYTTSAVSENHGSTSDLWGTTWTVSDINATNFGAAVAVTKASATGAAHTVSVDVVQLTVTYDLSPTFTQSAYRWFENQDATTGETFIKTWGGSSYDSVSSVIQTSDGGYAIAGQTNSYGTGGDGYLAKYDSTATLSWSRTWGGTGYDSISSIIQTSDGGYAVAGTTNSYGTGGDGYLAKFDSAGTLSWSRTWNLAYADGASTVIQTSDGGYAIAGYLTGPPIEDATSGFFAKYDSSGTLSWSKIWGNEGMDSVESIIQTSDGGYAIAGQGNSYGMGGGDAFLAKIDSSGALSWSRTWGGGSTEFTSSVVQTSDGGYAIAGSTDNYGSGSTDAFIAKYNSSGTLSWSRTWGGTGSDNAYDLIQTSDGGYAIVGQTNSYGTGGDAYLAKFDSAGTLSWSRTWGGAGSESTSDLFQTSGGGYVTAGSTASYGLAIDAYVARYDGAGQITNCSNCGSPSAGTTSPSAGTTSPSANYGNITGTTTSPTATTTSPTATTSTIVAASSANVGTTIGGVAQDTAVTLSGQSIVRLRMLAHVGVTSATGGSYAFKLQYASRGADNLCDTSFTNETYSDVTTSSTIAYANNTVATDNMGLASNANDPTHGSDTKINQSYEESNNINLTNTVATGQDAMWDFALKENGTQPSTTYCLRLVSSSGSVLTSYSVIPQITSAPVGMTQENYRWYQGQDSAPSGSFVQTLGGTDIDGGGSVVQTSDGGYAMASTTQSFDAGSGDMLISKHDSSGALSWSRTWGGTGDEFVYELIQTNDNGLLVVGATYGTGGPGDGAAFLVKYSASGTLQWNKSWGGPGDNFARGVVQTSDGGYAITGYTNGFGSNDAILLKFDASGNLEWNKSWDSSGYDEGNSIVQTLDGGYAITGTTDGYGAGGYDIFVAKFNSYGALSWTKTWGSTATDYASSIIQTADGGYAVAGQTNGFGATSGDLLFLKFDADGALSWSTTKGASGTDIGYDIIQTKDGGYAIAGSSTSYGIGGSDVIVSKYDASGSHTWTKTWGSAASDGAGSIAQTSDGGYIVGGGTSGHGAGVNDIALIKFTSEGTIFGCTSTCGISAAPATSVSGTITSPSATLTSPSGTVVSPSVTTSSPAPTTTAVLGYMTFATASGGAGTEVIKSVIHTPDGGYAVAGGTTSSATGGAQNAYIAKYDSAGTLSWSNSWGGAGDDFATSIIRTSDGGYALSGWTEESGSGYNFFASKYTSSGTLSWATTVGDFDIDTANSITETSLGELAVTGETYDFNTGLPSAYLGIFDTSGGFGFAQLWGAGYGQSRGNSITSTSDSGLVVTGTIEGFSGVDVQAFIVKFDLSGVRQWDRVWGEASGADTPNSVIQTSDGGYAVAGTTNSYGAGNTDAFLTRLSSSSAIIGSSVWGGAGADTANSVIQTSDGGFAVSGSTTSYGAGNTDAFLTKFSNAGGVAWSKTWGTANADTGNSIVQTTDGGYILAGATYNTGNSSNDGLLLKYNASGDIIGCSSLCASPTPTVATPAFTNVVANIFDTSTGVSLATTSSTTRALSLSNSVKVVKATSTTSEAVPGTALAAQDTAAASTRHDAPLRLRLALKPTRALGAGDLTFKLQVAPRVGVCDPSFTGETYVDLGSSSAFNYYNNPTLTDGQFAIATSFDPTPGSGTIRNGSYIESTNFKNRHGLMNGKNELVDISLAPTDEAIYGNYCFRIVNSDNSPLVSYTRVFELSIPPAASQQLRHGQFFDEQGGAGLTPYYW